MDRPGATDPAAALRPLPASAAGALWRCPACGATRAGFAFPFGRCPGCDGALDRQPGDSPALEALRHAFEIELGGRAFYQRAATEATDPALRALFRRFAVMEGEHMEALSRRYGLALPDPSPTFRLATAAVHAGLAAAPPDAEALFRIAIALEQRAAAHFAAQAAQLPAGSPERQLYEELAQEEDAHAQALALEHGRWREGGPGRLRAPGSEGGPRLNGAELLLAGHPDDDTALECNGERLSYGALRDRVARAAAVWRARGLRPGDRVAVRLPDGFDWVVAWLGALWAGGVAVGVNPRIPAPEWQFILEEAGFDVIVAESAADTPAPWCDKVITLEEGRRAVAAAQPVPALPVPAEAPAFWVHSSGTSGKPKAVVHAHRCLQAIGRVSAERLGLGRGDRLFASSRLFFAYPLTNLLLAGLRVGATLLLEPQWPTARSVAALVAERRPTVLFSVPSLYRDLLHERLAADLPASGLRRCVSAGEALPASLRRAWHEATGLPMIDGYGASEVLALVLTAVDGDDGLRPSPGTEVQPLDAAAAEAGGPTRLLIRCATQALGYLDRPAAQADSFRDGAFCPADLFVRTAGGGWRFAGREDALVKIRGRWVNLVELEEQLASGLPGVREAAAVCVPDADGIESVALFYAGDDGPALREALAARVAALPPYQRPAWLQPIAALPRTPTGKLLRRRLQELHRHGG
jgi:acyl-coenzyme A synthetase/AMP-(fatty) acid ligase/rubrerythrin